MHSGEKAVAQCRGSEVDAEQSPARWKRGKQSVLGIWHLPWHQWLLAHSLWKPGAWQWHQPACLSVGNWWGPQSNYRSTSLCWGQGVILLNLWHRDDNCPQACGNCDLRQICIQNLWIWVSWCTGNRQMVKNPAGTQDLSMWFGHPKWNPRYYKLLSHTSFAYTDEYSGQFCIWFFLQFWGGKCAQSCIILQTNFKNLMLINEFCRILDLWTFIWTI